MEKLFIKIHKAFCTTLLLVPFLLPIVFVPIVQMLMYEEKVKFEPYEKVFGFTRRWEYKASSAALFTIGIIHCAVIMSLQFLIINLFK